MTYKDMKAIEKALETMIDKTEVEKEGIRSLQKANSGTANEEIEKHYEKELERLKNESADFRAALNAIRSMSF